MKNLSTVLSTIASSKLKINRGAKDIIKLNQNQRNDFKATALSALLSDLEECEEIGTIGFSKDGVIFSVPLNENADFGVEELVLTLDVKINALNTNVTEVIEEHTSHKEEVERNKLERAKKAKKSV